ncbi:TPA: type II toxin-antitoxin system RelB/DinJ family antitoxin [Enterococcus faecalis]|uniref:type II toxin-antitoxin system RelB/DinJ family antitoxin n=1 Tax=Enterococcus faecalis TaxID=1351 RepID=UPI0019274377|nr:type II toxin-antitoxin system RelB/DinJ family antitoxin [Enterococcus faecalis]EGO8494298.1 type II toxin-antitoxin system RelB/DinJ family antitoxin [Enterococcus faecalis]EKN1413231.1 type II toxin-antitoxin system RelB/DinJ family antitoxin [Enterococcus faecalis]MDN3201738.1 type II toxin-antitoxin system RelB/DinJ family antitoxin [Enterococcus faecalis]MDT2227869.1 type II toxin-antitoxin system RelB/DinJ family antitoxin [Enterococcus faecalis]HAP3820618.1 type II toxin-antitoxin s
MANIRVDDELKNNADKMFDEVGMSTSTAVKIFLTRFVNTGKFPFDIETTSYQPNTETIQAFEETKELIEKGNLKNNESLSAYFERMKKEVSEETDA